MADQFSVDWGVAEAMRDFQNLSGVLGSSAGTTSSLSLMGGALGVSDIRGAAEALHRATLAGGLSTATASRYGLEMRPNEIGNATDRGAMLLQAIEGLRDTMRTRGRGQALSDARNLNLEDWFGLVEINDQLFQRMKAQAEVSAQLYSPERLAQAMMFNSQLAMMNQSFKDMSMAWGTLLMPYLEAWAKTFEEIAKFGIRLAGGTTDGPASNNSLGQSMESLKSAVQENSSALRQTAGMWGGGPRFRSAIPAAFGPGRGHQIDDNLRALSSGVDAASIKF